MAETSTGPAPDGAGAGPINLARFRRDLSRRREQLGVTWNTLAGMSGVSPAMFTRINSGSSVTLEAFAQICASCRLDPTDYMPSVRNRAWDSAERALERYAEIEPWEAETIIGMAKADAALADGTPAPREREERKTLEANGTRFDIGDIEMRRHDAWTDGPAVVDAKLSDGTTLGSVMESDGQWLWHISGGEWHQPMPAAEGRTLYVDQGGREAAVSSLLEAIAERYAIVDRNADPWKEILDAQADGPEQEESETTTDTADPWIPADPWAPPTAGMGEPLPMPDPGVAPTMPGTEGPGMAL